MPVLHTPESGHAKEMCRWNAHHTQYGPPGRPFQQQDYPARMYKAERKPDGTRAIVDAENVNDAREREASERRGFTWGGQGAAIAALDAQEATFAQLAAERNFEVRRMSERAQAEVRGVEDAAGARHLPMIPETPVVRKGWPKGKPRKPAQAEPA